MLDSKYLRQEIETARRLLASRHFELDVTTLTALEEQRRQSMTRTQDLQAQRNRLSKAIGSALRQGAEVQALRDEVARVGEELTAVKRQQDAVLEQIRAIAETIPNLPDASVPPGEDEQDNVEVRRVGTPRCFDFPILDHATLGEQLGMLDFERARRLSGARFAVLRGPLCALQRAVVRLMLDLHVQQQGYTECCVPYLVTPECLYGTGQLPKFSADLFHTALRGTAEDEGETRRFCLIPTAEVPLTNLVRNEILNAADLPLRLTAHTPCFRSEAGSAGRDTRGLIRMHQFDKVEMVQVVEAAHSPAALEQLTQDAEAVLQALELPYRVVCLCTGDLGFSAAKTYDLEVWLPAQHAYREISSCSNCTDFQARRMQTRVRTQDGALALAHTLNGSGLAVGRTLVAILENYQNADGSVTIPAVLRPYLNGQEKLEVHRS